MTPATLLPPHSVAPDWRHASGGIWRLTYRRYLSTRNLLIAAGLFAGLALLAFTSLRAGQVTARDFVDWAVDAYLGFAVPVAAFLIGAGQIRDDMEAATVDYVLTRPVSRPLFLAARYLSNLACLQAACLCGLVTILAVGAHRSVPGLPAIAGWALLTQALAATAYSAMGFAFGAATGRYLVAGILYAALVEAGLGQIPTQLSRLSMHHHLQTIMARAPGGWTPSGYHDGPAVAILALLAFSAVLAGAATALFTMRELAGSRARES